jgi:RNA polymerase sigma-70 factor, ECF subfamily
MMKPPTSITTISIIPAASARALSVGPGTNTHPGPLSNELCQGGNYQSKSDQLKTPFSKSNSWVSAKNSFREYAAESADYSSITGLLIDWSKGDRIAFDKVLPLVEKELRRLAHGYMRRERAEHTLQTTALINEAYLKLIDQKKTRWQNRAHFFGIAAKIMRRILLNYARDQQRLKRGGKATKVPVSEAMIMPAKRAKELVALDDALNKLATIDNRKCQVVELRYFGGLDIEEAAAVLKISEITVMRDWKFAKAWLKRELENAW